MWQGTPELWVSDDLDQSSIAPAADLYQAIAMTEPIDQFVSKQGRTTGRYRLPSNQGELNVFIKKYYHAPWWSRLLPAQFSEGMKERENLRLASELGIRVPRVIAAGADPQHKCKSFLVVEELSGYQPLDEFIPFRFSGKLNPETLELKLQLIEGVADIARRLHSARLYHQDFYLCHFFIKETPEASAPFDLVLIDLTRLIYSTRGRWRVKDLGQLLFSSDFPQIDDLDRLHFMKSYLQSPRMDARLRRLARSVSFKAWFYRRHNRRVAA